MSNLDIFIYRDRGETPDRTISVPLAVLRLNPRLLPKDISLALERQGVDISEIAALQGIAGPVLDITSDDIHILVSISGSEDTPPAPIPTASPPPPVQPPPTPAVAPAPEPIVQHMAIPTAEPAPSVPVQRPRSTGNTFLDNLTTEFIAQELGWRTGHDLIFAACVHMTLVDKRKTWDKESIDLEIREVGKYYKPFYSTNLDEYLQYLMKNGKLAIADNKEYELTPSMVKYLDTRLAEEKIKKRMFR